MSRQTATKRTVWLTTCGVVFIGSIEGFMSVVTVSLGIFFLAFTSLFGQVIGSNLRSLIIVSVIHSSFQLITVIIGVCSLCKNHLCMVVTFCTLNFGHLLINLVMMLFLTIERLNFMDSIESNMQRYIEQTNNYAFINATFNCNIKTENLSDTAEVVDFDIDYSNITSSLVSCSSDWMDTALIVGMGIGYGQCAMLYIIIILALTCAFNKWLAKKASKRRRVRINAVRPVKNEHKNVQLIRIKVQQKRS